MEPLCIPLNLTQENHPLHALPLEHIIMNPLPIMMIGDKEFSQTLTTSENPLLYKKETNLESPLLSLKSHVKPHVLLENPPKVRVLQISKEDAAALYQVISEFQQF